MLSKCSSYAWPGLRSASRPRTVPSLDLHRQALAGPQACTEQPVPDTPAASGSAAVYQKLVEGKRFTCTQCGACCTGSGDVWVNEADTRRMAAHLHIKEADFLRRYAKKYTRKSGWWLLRSTGQNQDCIFLGKDNACSVHTCKPLQCTTYPWWCVPRPDLMDACAWLSERETVCEGMDHAEARACDPVEAGHQLMLSTAHFAARDAASLTTKRWKGPRS